MESNSSSDGMSYPSPKALVRSDIWFSDGNIVLVAGYAAFKVHRGQLERHSDVFRDLFSVPQPAEQSLVDGCPSVELYDSPCDVHHLLIALYDGLYFQKSRANDFPAIAGVLRLSSKYFIEHLRLRCITRLELDWPSTLLGWDQREQEATYELGRYVPRDAYPHPILVVNLALELGLDEFLSSAFYDLSRYGPSKILAGTRVPPPAFVSPDPSCSQAPSESSKAATDSAHPAICLSIDDLFRTFRGREQSQLYIHTFLETALRDRPSPNCMNTGKPTAAHCFESFYFIQLNVLRSVGGIAYGRDADPLFTLVQAMEMLERTDFSDGVKQCGLKMCIVCKAEFADSVRKARMEVWGKIPGWFGLAD
ncbi:hypothetical protein BJ138DRAFT_1055900, partial [Hygrophoropsis aurantiaca]